MHQETHKKEKCNFCDRSFQSLNYEARKRHINVAHKNHVKCSKCRLTFLNLEKLKLHQQTHVGKKYLCKYCPKIFTTTNGRYLHSKLIHDDYVRCNIP